MANKRFIDFPIATTVGDNDIILIWQGGANKQTTKATILSGVPDSLNDLTDVTISGLTNGQILRYDSVSGKWENTDQGNLDLNDLNDVTIVSPTNGQVLVYNSSTSKWENSSGGYVPYVGAVTTVNLGAQTIQAGSFVKQGGTASQFLKADGSVDSTAYGTGSVTSVGLTMPAAFNVANSPITTAGTLAVTGAGTVAQYIRGDGSLADFPESSGGGSSVSYYLNGSVAQGTIGGIAYKELNKVPILGAGTDFTINADGYIASFITDAGDPNLLEIPGGNWNFETYFSASSGGGSPTFYVELYKVNAGGTATLIASSSTSPELIAFGTNLTPYFSSLAVPTTTLALTDRLAVRYYVTHSGRTITLHTENNHLCQIITTFTTGLTALNGLTAQVQNFAVGTTGTDFNIASATATHTFNLPTASATNRGALSTSDWSMFNAKENAITAGTTAQYFRGDKTFQTLNTAAVPELTNLYYTEARVNANTNVAANTAARHNAVTLGTANGLSLSTQVLSLGLASAGVTGALSGTDWSTFNNKANSDGSNASGTWGINITGNAATASAVAWSNISGQRTLTRDDAGLQGNAGARSGFFETNSPVNYYSGATSWQHLIESRHTNDSNNYAMQIAGSFFDQEFYVRKTNNSATTAWNKLWHSGNITPVTSVTASSPLASSGGTTPNITIQQASGSQSGFLSSTDWTTFNSKQNSLTNPVTGTGTGTTNVLPKFTGSTTIGNSSITDTGSLVTFTTLFRQEGQYIQIVNSTNPSLYINNNVVQWQNYVKSNSNIAFSDAVRDVLTLGYNGSPSFFQGCNLLVGTNSDNGARLQVSGDSGYSKGIVIKNSSSSSNNLSVLTLEANADGYPIIEFKEGATQKWQIYNDWNNDSLNFYKFFGTPIVVLSLSSTGEATFSSSVGVGGTNTDSLFTINGTAGTSHERFREGSSTVGFVGGANGIITGHNGKLAVRAESGLVLSGTGNSPDCIIASGGAATFSSSVTAGTDVTLNNGTLFVSAGSGTSYAGRLSTAYIFPYITTYLDSFAGAGWEGRLQFRTNSAGGAMNTQMTILNSGNVGIGTTSPDTFSYGGNRNFLTLRATATNQEPFLQLIANGSGNSLIDFGNDTIRRATIIGFDGSHLAFFTNGSNSGTGVSERMRITSGGSVGINNTSPMNSAWGNDTNTKQLSIDATNYAVINLQGSTGRKYSMGVGDGNFYMCYDNTAARHNITISSAGNMTVNGTADNGNRLQVNGTIWSNSSVTATSFFESSDATLKTLLQDNYQAKGIDSVVAKLYIKNGKEELGYFAQDLQAVLPSAVSKGSDGLLNLSYREVHTAKIAYLEEKIKQLEKKYEIN